MLLCIQPTPSTGGVGHSIRDLAKLARSTESKFATTLARQESGTLKSHPNSSQGLDNKGGDSSDEGTNCIYEKQPIITKSKCELN